MSNVIKSNVIKSIVIKFCNTRSNVIKPHVIKKWYKVSCYKVKCYNVICYKVVDVKSYVGKIVRPLSSLVFLPEASVYSTFLEVQAQFKNVDHLVNFLFNYLTCHN